MVNMVSHVVSSAVSVVASVGFVVSPKAFMTPPEHQVGVPNLVLSVVLLELSAAALRVVDSAATFGVASDAPGPLSAVVALAACALVVDLVVLPPRFCSCCMR